MNDRAVMSLFVLRVDVHASESSLPYRSFVVVGPSREEVALSTSHATLISLNVSSTLFESHSCLFLTSKIGKLQGEPDRGILRRSSTPENDFFFTPYKCSRAMLVTGLPL